MHSLDNMITGAVLTYLERLLMSFSYRFQILNVLALGAVLYVLYRLLWSPTDWMLKDMTYSPTGLTSCKQDFKSVLNVSSEVWF